MSQQTELFKLNPALNWFNIKKSSIHGLGLFSARQLQPNEELGIALIKKAHSSDYSEHLIEGFGYQTAEDDWLRVVGVRFINHSSMGNIRLEHRGNQVLAYANQVIDSGTEITTNYAEIYQQINLPIPDFCK